MTAGAMDLLTENLPAGWTLTTEEGGPRAATRKADLMLQIRSPEGAKSWLMVEVKRSALPASIPEVVRQLREWTGPRMVPLLVFPYVGPRARAHLRSSGVSYLDMTGNADISVTRPGLTIRLSGARSDPWKIARPVRSLKGPKSGRVVRALCDWLPPTGVRELAARASVSPGYVSRLLAFLEGEDVLKRSVPPRDIDDAEDWRSGATLERRGPVVEVDWLGLLERWTEDYGVLRSNEVTRWLEPRGAAEVLRRLRTTTRSYALTSAAASGALAGSVAPMEFVVCLTMDPLGLARELGLREVVSAANVFLVRPMDEALLARSRPVAGVVCAAASQVLADLTTTPGRAASERTTLVDWMRRHESTWRTGTHGESRPAGDRTASPGPAEGQA